MKVLHIINSAHGGGAEKLVCDWSENPGKYEIDVFVLEKMDGQLCSSHYISSGEASAYSIKNFFAVVKHIAQYDVIHVHLFPAQLFVAVASIFFPKKKFITTEHSTFNRRRNNKFLRWLDRLMYRAFDCVGCISPAVEDALVRYTGSLNTVVISNGVLVDKIRKSPSYIKEDLGVNENAFVLCMVSRFSKEKDQMTVIKAMQCLPDHFVLLLVGKGSCDHSMRNLFFRMVLKIRLNSGIPKRCCIYI